MASSRDKEQPPPHHHQPLLSSLVVRPSHTEAAAGARAADFEPGELHRDPPPPYSRSDRYPDEPALMLPARSWALRKACYHELSFGSCSGIFFYLKGLINELDDGNSFVGAFAAQNLLHGFSFCRVTVICLVWDICERYRIRAGSSSPIHRRDADHRFNSDYNHLSRSRGYGGGRDPGRYRDPSPPYGRGRVGGRPMGRAFDGPGFVSGLARGEGNGRNNPNVRPREGDWFCPDPLCGNLNFARRDHCNSCNRSRNAPAHAPARSPRRAYPAPPPLHAPPRRYLGPPIDRSPERPLNGYRSPPRGLARDGPREYGPPPLDWDSRDRGRDGFSDERKGFERRPLSPPAPLLPSLPHHRGGRWARDVRERSRSPIRGGPPPKDYRRDTFMNRARDDRRGMGRDRIGGMY
uniref:TATA-binding protein-associated factor 2N n=1 Tax=Cajanus cajan TaxID=3821 RepID=A0A151TIT1_CAJCA|nr:TATA-binding protein-associated factor 2N [Cajanus cajan]